MKLSPAEVKALIAKGATLGPPPKLPSGKPWAGFLHLGLSDMKVKSEANRSRQEHWGTTAKRVKLVHERIWNEFRLYEPPPVETPLRVEFTRLYNRHCQAIDEGDNLAMAFKSARDAVAKWLGRDDGVHSRVEWLYRQKRATTLEVLILITETT